MRFGYLLASALIFAASAQAAGPTSVYTKLTDSNECAAEISALEGSDGGESYDCPGPVAGTGTLLVTGGDWDHLHLLIDDKQYSLWEPMVAVGSWSGIGNKQGIAEWRFKNGNTKSRASLQAFIVRFEGTVMGSDGNAKGTRSELAVFGLTSGKICWKGNYATNATARKAATSAACKTMLTAETPSDQ